MEYNFVIEKTQYGFTDKNGKPLLTLDNHQLTAPYHMNKHTHHVLEISITKSGRGIYEIGNTSYDIQPYDVFVIGNSEPHCIHVKDNETISSMVIHFETTFLWNFYGQNEDMHFLDIFFNRSKNFSNRLDRQNPATREVYNLLLQIETAIVDSKPYHNLYVKIVLETILYKILSNYDYCNFDETNSRSVSKKDMYQISEVMTYIDFNIDKHLTLNELSQIACVSPAYFSSIFKKYTGLTLFEFITKKRVEYAIQLIKTTNKSLTEIAMLSGFNSSTSFNKAFHRINGASPSQYRKNFI